MKLKNKLILLLSSLMTLSVVGNLATVDNSFVNKILTNTGLIKDFSKPDITNVFAEDEEEDDEDEIGEVDKVILHYVNDDNACNGRAFYVWFNGIDGEEYSNEVKQPERSKIVNYAADGSSMTITIDFKEDTQFTRLFGQTSYIMYIIKYKMKSESDLNWGGQSEDVKLEFAKFPPVNGIVEVWCTPAAGGGIAQFATEEETKVDGVKLAKFIDWKTIRCTLTPTANDVKWSLYAFDETYFKVKAKNRPAIKRNYLVAEGESDQSIFNIKFKYEAHINVVYSIVSKDKSSKTDLEKTIFVSFEDLYKTPEFEQYYTPKTVTNLGMTYSKNQTTFKVWSPVAANINVLVYDYDTDAAFYKEEDFATTEEFELAKEKANKYKGWHMAYTPGGVWELTLRGDLKGKYYAYQVDTWATSDITMDPYATGCGANGLRGLIYDKSESNPTNWDTLPVKWDGNAKLDIKTPQDLSIYEVHIQDFTGDSTWISNKGNANGTYNAFVEKGTKLTQNGHTVSTGFDHLKELGVKAVQLMPLFDFDNDEVVTRKYNWGYNPLNYNCVEGLYSSNPHDGLVRIKEYKNLIYQLSTIGTRVIMDVVYNHVSSPTASCFNKLMPRYYFRYDEKGELQDGSGCHNEFRSEATMARKFIVDSVCMWAKEYKVKGFRFDLMGLIDVRTMEAIKKALYQIDPDIYIYGEGWTADGFHGEYDFEYQEYSSSTMCCNGDGNNTVYADERLNKGPSDQQIYLGGFNDAGRNTLRGGNDPGWGSTTHLPGWGFMQHGSNDSSADANEELRKMIYGGRSIGWAPTQTVNYASCHDNWTLRDQYYYTLGNASDKGGNVYDIMHATEASHAMIFASNGVAFMLGGEELMRTKDVDILDKSSKEFKAVLPNTYENMYGHLVSHNSYNSPLEVNSFKWGNKIEITIDGITVDAYKENMTGMFASMIKHHNEMYKYDYQTVVSMVTIAEMSSDNLIWCGKNINNEDSNVCFGVKLDKYFIFCGGREFGYVSSDTSGWTLKVAAGVTGYDKDNKTVNLGGADYNTGFACAIYEAGGTH